MSSAAWGYRTTLRHPVAGTLFRANVVSILGDYIGQGALLFLAFERTGQVVGSAGVLAAAGIPALLTSGLGGTWLDLVPRKRALVTFQLVGAIAIVLPVLVGGVPIIYLAAGLLGGVRAGTVAVRSAAVAEGVPADLRGTLLAMLGTAEQSGQVVGYLTGAALFALVGADTALSLDALSFLVAAVILASMPITSPERSSQRPPATAGLREIFGHPVLRLLAVLVWVTAAVGALPETVAAGVVPDGDPWRPIVLAAAPFGQALTFLILGRSRRLVQPSFQLTHLAWLSLAFGLAVLAPSAAWLALANVLVGSGVAWTVGPLTTFVRLASPERMAQITGTMIAGLIAAEAAGSLALAAFADRTSVAAAYRLAGIVVLAAVVVAWLIKERMPEASDLDLVVIGHAEDGATLTLDDPSARGDDDEIVTP